MVACDFSGFLLRQYTVELGWVVESLCKRFRPIPEVVPVIRIVVGGEEWGEEGETKGRRRGRSRRFMGRRGLWGLWGLFVC